MVGGVEGDERKVEGKAVAFRNHFDDVVDVVIGDGQNFDNGVDQSYD